MESLSHDDESDSHENAEPVGRTHSQMNFFFVQRTSTRFDTPLELLLMLTFKHHFNARVGLFELNSLAGNNTNNNKKKAVSL